MLSEETVSPWRVRPERGREAWGEELGVRWALALLLQCSSPSAGQSLFCTVWSCNKVLVLRVQCG